LVLVIGFWRGRFHSGYGIGSFTFEAFLAIGHLFIFVLYWIALLYLTLLLLVGEIILGILECK